jgi:undecaprenyl-diphosphatase
MSLFQAFILGIVQGLTEFLPISSSAHLVLTPYLFQWTIASEATFVFDVLVQVGTLIAVVFYFRKDIWAIARAWFFGLRARNISFSPESRLGWMILIATIPAGIFGLFVKDQVEDAFNSPLLTAVFLLGTAIMLFVSEKVGKHNRNLDQMNWRDAIWIGAFQALAVFPGISRSGSTIAGGITRNLGRIPAARFSFLMSLPIMLAAGVLAVVDLIHTPTITQYLPIIGVGFFTSTVIGYLSIHWLLRFLNQHSLSMFAIYCAILGLSTIVTIFLNLL